MTLQLFRNAAIYTPRDNGCPAAGRYQGQLIHFDRGALAVQDGMIHGVGHESELLADLPSDTDVEEIDCQGQCLIPGFVDPHTHICFANPREEEFAQRIQGTPYLEILQQGGGILSSVKAVAAAQEDDLLRTTHHHADAALTLGTTTIEIKSGYGLDTDTELKMLRVIDRLARQTPQDVVPTFMGAHAVPAACREEPQQFVQLVVEEMLPAIRDQGIARYCDVFCEQGVFSVEQSRQILQAAAAQGLGLKIHADEVHDQGGGGLAAELQAVSADHLLAVSDENILRLAAAGTVAVLLPATAYSLRKPYARARQMIENRLPVALATDCNPGSSFTESMPFVFGLAVMIMELSPAEALTAATLNAAYAVGMAGRVGSLEAGKQADFLLLDGCTPAIIAYRAGVSPVTAVYKKGVPVA